jgi:adenosylcobinamide amidohydrolase
MDGLELHWRDEDGKRLPMLAWRPGPGWRMISSAILGGGIGSREWVLNAQVRGGYSRMDPVEHLGELAAGLGLAGPGVGLLTAAQVTEFVQRDDCGVRATSTVGLRVPTWAAAPDDVVDPELHPIWVPGTINLIVSVPVPLTDAAFVNAVITATEAKSQALIEAGFPATGTASDAICVAAPVSAPSSVRADASPSAGRLPEQFAGPRSLWGARIARAVHAAVTAGAESYPHRP